MGNGLNDHSDFSFARSYAELGILFYMRTTLFTKPASPSNSGKVFEATKFLDDMLKRALYKARDRDP